MKCPELWKKFFLRQTNKLNICVFLTDSVVVTLESTCWAIILKMESIVLELLGIDICTSVPCIVCLKTLPGRPAANKTDKAWKRTLLPLYKLSKNWWHKNITRAIRHFLGISDECVKCLSSIHLSKYRSLIKFTMYKTQISYSFVNI